MKGGSWVAKGHKSTGGGRREAGGGRTLYGKRETLTLSPPNSLRPSKSTGQIQLDVLCGVFVQIFPLS